MVGGLDTSGMTPGDIDRYVRATGLGAGPVHAARAGAGRTAAGPDLDSGPVPGLRHPVRAGQRRAGLPGLPRGRADPGSAFARRGTGLDPGRRAASRVRRTRHAAGRRAPRPAGPRRGERGRAEPARGGRARVGGSAVYRRATGYPISSPRPAAGRWRPRPAWRRCRPTGRPSPRPRRTWWWSRRAATTCPARSRRRSTPLQALPDVPVWAIDADGIVVRPGPRLVNGVEALARSCTPGPCPRRRPGPCTGSGRSYEDGDSLLGPGRLEKLHRIAGRVVQQDLLDRRPRRTNLVAEAGAVFPAVRPPWPRDRRTDREPVRVARGPGRCPAWPARRPGRHPRR